MQKIAIYGKGGIGKSTLTSHLAAAFARLGKRVIQIGCDPKADSTSNLLGGQPLTSVMGYLREHDEPPQDLAAISRTGFGGVLCIETGGPTPGLGCAGRGIIATFDLLEDLSLFETFAPDVVLYEEPLDERVWRAAMLQIHRADTLIVGGTSLLVYPAAGLVDYFQGTNLVVINLGKTSRDACANLAIAAPIGRVFKEAVLCAKSA